jgi:tetraacyldisaccharide 4'-kinase
MKKPFEAYFREVMSGSDRSAGAAALRAAAACAEPVYSMSMGIRNRLYDSGKLKAIPLGRPTISVGNITVGGTGKTPMVQWLAARFSTAGERPAILLRGYKSNSTGLSDERSALEESLKSSAGGAVTVIADANRVRGAATALGRDPRTNLFILDDGMQHRRARRDFELVLINATEPFGFGHIFPRGTLREPLKGLGRADAFVLTHADEVDQAERQRIGSLLRGRNSRADVFQANHVIEAMRIASGETKGLGDFAGARLFAFCGIGSPATFVSRLAGTGATCVGAAVFSDHHHYRPKDLGQIMEQAASSGAQFAVTTEKDWAKLASMPQAMEGKIPILRAQLSLRFSDGDDERLFAAIRGRLKLVSSF